ncbi:hypothetical protein FORC066_1270 [Yersinia enterocolitica]|nr:hypothetical protein FORC065_3174 [Yersinia enterocolitica]UXD28485.1 hypothetical protein FORC066_1270 [Yersinia enterocolitica]
MVISNSGFILLGLTTLSFNIVDLNMAVFNIIYPYLAL